jgi:hypothetical protein
VPGALGVIFDLVREMHAAMDRAEVGEPDAMLMIGHCGGQSFQKALCGVLLDEQQRTGRSLTGNRPARLGTPAVHTVFRHHALLRHAGPIGRFAGRSTVKDRVLLPSDRGGRSQE